MLEACPLVESLSTAMALVPPVVEFVAVAAWVASLIVQDEVLRADTLRLCLIRLGLG